jgi:hypothetical protein
LKSHARAFDGLLSLIPAKYYYGEDKSVSILFFPGFTLSLLAGYAERGWRGRVMMAKKKEDKVV